MSRSSVRCCPCKARCGEEGLNLFLCLERCSVYHSQRNPSDGRARRRRGLAELDRCTYDVVLLNVKIAGMDGIEGLKTLRERRCPAEVIILSGHAAVDTAMAIVRLGAFDYLPKPRDTEVLLD